MKWSRLATYKLSLKKKKENTNQAINGAFGLLSSLNLEWVRRTQTKSVSPLDGFGKYCDAIAGQHRNRAVSKCCSSFFLSVVCIYFTLFSRPSHLFICDKKWVTDIWNRRTILKKEITAFFFFEVLTLICERRTPAKTDLLPPASLILYLATSLTDHRVPLLTWAMLVMKKGSQALKKSPSRTPRVKLALSALRPCLWASRRSLFTDGWWSREPHSVPEWQDATLISVLDYDWDFHSLYTRS